MQSLIVAHENSTQKAELRAAIERYIAESPLSGDTAKGIVECWLPEQGCEDAREHIEAVLAELVADNWLEPRALPGGDVLYVTNLKRCSTSR